MDKEFFEKSFVHFFYCRPAIELLPLSVSKKVFLQFLKNLKTFFEKPFCDSKKAFVEKFLRRPTREFV